MEPRSIPRVCLPDSNIMIAEEKVSTGELIFHIPGYYKFICDKNGCRYAIINDTLSSPLCMEVKECRETREKCGKLASEVAAAIERFLSFARNAYTMLRKCLQASEPPSTSIKFLLPGANIVISTGLLSRDVIEVWLSSLDYRIGVVYDGRYPHLSDEGNFFKNRDALLDFVKTAARIGSVAPQLLEIICGAARMYRLAAPAMHIIYHGMRGDMEVESSGVHVVRSHDFRDVYAIAKARGLYIEIHYGYDSESKEDDVGRLYVDVDVGDAARAVQLATKLYERVTDVLAELLAGRMGELAELLLE